MHTMMFSRQQLMLGTRALLFPLIGQHLWHRPSFATHFGFDGSRSRHFCRALRFARSMQMSQFASRPVRVASVLGVMLVCLAGAAAFTVPQQLKALQTIKAANENRSMNWSAIASSQVSGPVCRCAQAGRTACAFAVRCIQEEGPGVVEMPN